ncbi:MAG: hypothetical protein ACREA0_31445, partial [bacterium]
GMTSEANQITSKQRVLHQGCGTAGTVGMLLLTAVIALVMSACGSASGSSVPAAAGTGPVDGSADSKFCSATVTNAFNACGKEVEDDYLIAFAKCINESDANERAQCIADADEARSEVRLECGNQRVARQNVCTAVGEARYDPDFSPALFDSNFTALTNPNPYIPLDIGNTWQYANDDETVTIEVLNQTKLIEGVTCIVVNDRVDEDGDLVEDTNDWFAQARNGDVYYCGEEVKDYEHFDGDNPRREELVSIDGAFKVGRDGDKPGILFFAAPTVGKVYRLEFSLGNAEDIAEVLSTTYSVASGADPDLDPFVPAALKSRFCLLPGDCVVTKDSSPLSPDALERKYYAKGIGMFLE